MSNNSQSRAYCHCIDKHYNAALTVDALKLRDTFDKYILIIPNDANFREFKWSLLFVQHIVRIHVQMWMLPPMLVRCIDQKETYHKHIIKQIALTFSEAI